MTTISLANISELVDGMKMGLIRTPSPSFLVHPRTYFELRNPELAMRAYRLNEKHGKSIYDKRTRGWKLIKEVFNNQLT